jgi:hypothetical protein
VLETYSIGGATPLQGEAETDDTGNEHKQTKCVKLSQLVLPRHVSTRTVGNMEQEDDQQYHDSSEGKIEIETPSPGNLCSEGATDKRACYR